MARFYGQIEGQGRTMASRCGSRNSGIWSHVRGWRSGVEIQGFSDDDDIDTFQIFGTHGSNGPGERKLIATLYCNSAGELRIDHFKTD